MGSAPDSRRLQRIARLNALFSWEFYKSVGQELDPSAHPFIEEDAQLPEGTEPTESDETLGSLTQPELLAPIIEHIPDIDAAILRFAPKHDLDHFNKVDLAILRQALFELLYTSTPAAVVIDEAIELAKLYATSEAPSFVHGVLGNIVDERNTNREQEQEAQTQKQEEDNKDQHAA
jgi:transcription antitermination factor NusB